jgi:SAM-dependent methyltransferase
VSEPVWITANRANWDERVAVHLAPRGYDLTDLRNGRGRLCAIVEPELPPVAGKRVLHLQCHFGRDTLTLAQRGADVVGLDFSAPAIAAAQTLTAELGLTANARFILSDLYDAPAAIPEPAGFDLVYVTWGALSWLPDIGRWAEIVAGFLKPGGSIYLAEGHPSAMVLDDEAPQPNGDPGFFAPYFHSEPLVLNEMFDYADRSARLTNSTTYQWIHPLGSVVTALIAAGLRLDWLHEHDAITWQLFKCLTEGPDGLYRWADKRWLPLSYSLKATLPKSLATSHDTETCKE